MGPERVNCTWCFGSGEWVERRKIVPCKKCGGAGKVVPPPPLEGWRSA